MQSEKQDRLQANRPYLIVIRNGPAWKLDGLAALAECLGAEYEGEIWTFADSGEERVVGSFRIRRDGLPKGFGAISKAFRAARLVVRGLHLRWRKGQRLVVIAYDPLANGVIGAVIKLVTGARFVCEVNGVYGDPAVLMDVENQVRAEIKRKRMLRLGSWVLARADHIKLLFPEQLERFDGVPDWPPRAVFCDFINFGRFRFVETKQEPVLLFIGFPFLLKGVDVLLKAFSRVAPDFLDWRLVLIGFRLEENALKLGLPLDGVEFLGPQSQESVSRWLERCSALVLPSRSEAMGRVLLEAALKGRARLGSRVGGIPHYISHDIDGLLFEPDDVDDLERTLRRFMGDPGAPRRLGDAARARAEKEFTAEHYLSSYKKIISSLVT